MTQLPPRQRQGAERIVVARTGGTHLADLAAGQIAQRLTHQAVGIGGGQRQRRRAAQDFGARQVDAQLLGDIAVHLRDAHLQHHLLAARHVEHIDDLFGIARETRRQIGGASRFQRARNRAGQHHIVVHRLHLDRRIGQAVLHHAGKILDVALDPDVESQDLMAGAVEEEGVGLADLAGEQENAARRAHHRVHQFGIGDQHVARIGVELDDRRLVERQREAAMHRPAAGRNRHQPRILVARRRGRGRRGGQKCSQRSRQDSKAKTHDRAHH